jgi:hypothetical protein
LNNLALAEEQCGMGAKAIESRRRSAVIRDDFTKANPDEYVEPVSLTLQTLIGLEYSVRNAASVQAARERLIDVYAILLGWTRGSCSRPFWKGLGG